MKTVIISLKLCYPSILGAIATVVLSLLYDYLNDKFNFSINGFLEVILILILIVIAPACVGGSISFDRIQSRQSK